MLTGDNVDRPPPTVDLDDMANAVDSVTTPAGWKLRWKDDCVEICEPASLASGPQLLVYDGRVSVGDVDVQVLKLEEDRMCAWAWWFDVARAESSQRPIDMRRGAFGFSTAVDGPELEEDATTLVMMVGSACRVGSSGYVFDMPRKLARAAALHLCCLLESLRCSAAGDLRSAADDFIHTAFDSGRLG